MNKKEKQEQLDRWEYNPETDEILCDDCGLKLYAVLAFLVDGDEIPLKLIRLVDGQVVDVPRKESKKYITLSNPIVTREEFEALGKQITAVLAQFECCEKLRKAGK